MVFDKNHFMISKIQKVINIFAFFIFFPSLYLFGNSITFYFFLFMLYKSGNFWEKQYLLKIEFLFLLIFIYVSTIFSPKDGLERHPGFLSSVMILIQYTYWILIAIFFILYSKYIDLYLFGKWCFYGVIASIICFYLVRFNLNTGLFALDLFPTRNAFVFTLLTGIPISFFYLNKRYKGVRLFLFFPGFLVALFLTNGRSAAIIGFIEILFLAGLIYKVQLKLILLLVLPLIVYIFLFQTVQSKPLEVIVADKIEVLNPRMAYLLRGEGDGDLNEDRSWLHRKLMIEKGLEIFKRYPILGIGANNFKFYDGSLKTLEDYPRLSYLSNDYYNKRSAHNSYIQILAEFGILGLFVFILIFIRPIRFFKRSVFFQSDPLFHNVILISLTSMLIHFYSISSITGALPWLILGLANGFVIVPKIRTG
jgi:O-antigen ligase